MTMVIGFTRVIHTNIRVVLRSNGEIHEIITISGVLRRLYTNVIGSDPLFDEASELFLEYLVVIVLQEAHVLADVFTEDVVTVHVRAEALGITVVSREAAGAKNKGDNINLYKKNTTQYNTVNSVM